MLRAGRVSPLLKRKSLMTKSPSFWLGQWVVEGVCAKAAEAAVSSRAVAKARKVIGILQAEPGGSGEPQNRSKAHRVRGFSKPGKPSTGAGGVDTPIRSHRGLAKAGCKCHFVA